MPKDTMPDDRPIPSPTGLARVVRSTVVEQAAAQIIEGRRSPHTRKAYKADFSLWVDFCARMGLDLADPLLPPAILFRGELERAYSPATVHRVLASLSLIYRALVDNAVVKRNPFNATLLPRPILSSEGKTSLVTAAEAHAIIAAASADASPAGRRDVAVLRLLYDTGMRRESVASLLRADICDERAWITLKGGAKEPVVLLPETRAAITEWLRVAPASLYVFPGRNGGHVDVTTVNRLVSDRCVEAGCRHVHPHCFRAAFITAAYDSRVYERDIQKAVHHRKAETTRRYDRGQRGEHVAEAVAQFRNKEIP